jgi:integrase
MTKRRHHGDGGIDQRGPDIWRLRYRINGQRFSQTFHGSLSDARKEVRRLIRSGDTGEHVAPDKITLAQWVTQWIDAGAPGRRQKKVGRRTLERYDELLRCHVVPTLGARRIQQLQASEIDALYVGLEDDGELSLRTIHHVHTVFGACLGTAVRKGMLAVSPMERVEKVPSPGEANHGMVLDEDQLREIIEGFKGTVFFPMIALAALVGARRNEILGLRHSDLDPAKKTLRIERSVDHGLALKEPKNARHIRTIAIDDDLIAIPRHAAVPRPARVARNSAA